MTTERILKRHGFKTRVRKGKVEVLDVWTHRGIRKEQWTPMPTESQLRKWLGY
jgi:hypothetical protein